MTLASALIVVGLALAVLIAAPVICLIVLFYRLDRLLREEG